MKMSAIRHFCHRAEGAALNAEAAINVALEEAKVATG
jgi:hypothetical protein